MGKSIGLAVVADEDIGKVISAPDFDIVAAKTNFQVQIWSKVLVLHRLAQFLHSNNLKQQQ